MIKRRNARYLAAAAAAAVGIAIASHAYAFTDPTAGTMTLWVNTVTGDVELVGNNTTFSAYGVTSASSSILSGNWLKPLGQSPTNWSTFSSSASYISEGTLGSAVTATVTSPYNLGDIYNPSAPQDLVLHFVNASNLSILGSVQYGLPTLTWDPLTTPATGSDGSGNWDTSTAIWSNGATDQTWINGYAAGIGANGTAGTITIAASGITVSGLTFNAVTSGVYTIAADTGDTLSLSGTVTLNANAAISAPIVGTAPITIVGPDTLTLSGANTYTGETDINSGTLAVSGSGSIADSTLIKLTSSSSVLNISGAAGTVSIQSLYGASGSIVTLGANTLSVTAAGGYSFSGNIQGTGGLTVAGTGGGVLFMDGATTYTGATTITSTGVLRLVSGAIADSSSLTVDTGGVFDISHNAATQINNLAGGGTVSLGSYNLSVNVGSGSSAFSGLLADGGANGGTGGSITKTGAGILTLSGVSTFTGAATINGGTLALSGVGSIADSRGVVLSSGSTFDISGTTSGATILGLSGGGGTVSLGSQLLTINLPASQTDTYSGIVTGAGGITLGGSGSTEVLAGANTYTGATTITSGTLEFTGSTAGLTGAVTDNGTLDMAQTAGSTLSSAISGTGSLIDNGTAGTTLVLTGSNTFNGGITLNSGILSVSAEGNLGNSTNRLTLNGGELLSSAAFLTDSRPVTLSGPGGTIDIHGGQDSFSGVISGVGTLTLLDSAPTANSSVTLSGANTYSGGTVLNASHLIISSDGNLGAATGGLTLGNGAQLETTSAVNTARAIALSGTSADTINTDNQSETFSGVISGSAPLSITNFGGAVLTFSGANTYSGGTTLSGILAVSGDANLGSTGGSLTFAGGELRTTANLTTARSIILASGGGYLDTNGAHTDTLNGIISGSAFLNIVDSTGG